MSDTETTLSYQLDLMTDYLLQNQEIEFSDCILNWYRRDFKCKLVPEPDDVDAVRLAIKASIIERLVEVLNSPPHNGDQIVPGWCKQIKGLAHPLKLQSERLLEGEQYCEAFEKRNLQVVKNFMYFI